MAKIGGENFRLDFAVSREQTNAAGEKMYIQTRMAEYKEELWELLKKDNTYVYMCGLKGMEKGIDDIMVDLAAKDGKLSQSILMFLKMLLIYWIEPTYSQANVIKLFFFFCRQGINWIDYKKQLKKAEQWNVEVY